MHKEKAFLNDEVRKAEEWQWCRDTIMNENDGGK